MDAFPTDQFQGRVSAVRLNPTTVQNVVTYNTVIDFSNPDEKLLPGETAYVTIPTGHATNTLSIPNPALTFKPNLPRNSAAAALQAIQYFSRGFHHPFGRLAGRLEDGTQQGFDSRGRSVRHHGLQQHAIGSRRPPRRRRSGGRPASTGAANTTRPPGFGGGPGGGRDRRAALASAHLMVAASR